MAVQTGKTHLFGIYGTVAIYKADGSTLIGTYAVSPLIKSISFGHNATGRTITGTTGEVVGHIVSGGELTLTLDCIPEGTTIAVDATSGSPARSAGLPPEGGQVVISGMPVIVAGKFDDALNTTASPSTKWIYEGGGTLKGESEAEWTMTIPLRRFYAVGASAAVIA